MSTITNTTNGFTLRELVSKIHGSLGGREDGPTEAQIREACDVLYSSSLLKEEGRAVRARVIHRLVEDLMEECLPTSLDPDAYAGLAHLISLQFVKRIINLVRTSGHGGSLVFLPESKEGHDAAASWIDCKYSATPDVAGLRFGGLMQAIMRRVGQLCKESSQ